MPTFTAIALDSLIEQGASKTMSTARNVPDTELERRMRPPNPRRDRGMIASDSKLERRNSTSTASTLDKKHPGVPITPSLYATPEPTPLPDPPSSFPPSPYIINHKRRGPRLLKSFSEYDVAARKCVLDQDKVEENLKLAKEEIISLAKDDTFTVTTPSPTGEDHVNGICNGGLGTSDRGNNLAAESDSSVQLCLMDSVAPNLEDDPVLQDFLDPQDLMSAKSNTEGDINGGTEPSPNLTAPTAEFFDAWEELSTESGPQQPQRDLEAELREFRLSLLMEIEQRKQAEEALDNMRTQWLKIRQHLSLVGLTLSADPVNEVEDEQLGVDPAEELCRQVYVARCVSNSIGRGTAKAEVEMEMEAQLESKNFEITRLCDKLYYYEAVNREMSQRNQEAVEIARRLRHRRKIQQRWAWGLIATSIALGVGALSWSYMSAGRGSSTTSKSVPHECDLAGN